MVELKHNKLTYYIEKDTEIDQFGNEGDTIYYLKRYKVLWGYTLPFLKYVKSGSSNYGDTIYTKKPFASEEETIEFFHDYICKITGKPHRKLEIIKTLKC